MGKTWYISEKGHSEQSLFTAGEKAREDVDSIFNDEGLEEIKVDRRVCVSGSLLAKLLWHINTYKSLRDSIVHLEKGDNLYMQIPLENHSIFVSRLLKNIHKKGVKIIGLVHDVDRFRFSLSGSGKSRIERMRIKLEERAIHQFDWLIVHNKRMIDEMVKIGFRRESLVPIDLFDYLIPNADINRIKDRSMTKDMPIVIAGFLSPYKAGYVYKLPDNIQFALYGKGYDGGEKEGILYKGVFEPDELPYYLEGSFGLVWDGESIDTCSGIYGEYLRLNNPHKASLYFASGLPIIIWREAALSQFVEKNKCGFCVDQLTDIPHVIKTMTNQEYYEMKENADRIGNMVRSGYFLRNALNWLSTKI